MYKRLISVILCLCLLAAALPGGVRAETDVTLLSKSIPEDYYRILENTNMASLQGYCGLMASWQLFFLGVNDWVMSHHGKDQFDAYEEMAVTSGGHRVQTYSAADYTLEEALNAITAHGSRDVFNILVGFQQTSSALGSIYGHSVVLYGIVGGTVYFTESYDTSLGPAGAPYRVSIAEFADYYDDWTVFEGLVLFGKKGYAANCERYAANLFAEVTQSAQICSQPCTPETPEADCQYLRTALCGERLWVNALYENPEGKLYYQIDDSGVAGYVAAEAVTPIRLVYEDVEIFNVQTPADVARGDSETITGRIASMYSSISGVQMELTDETGQLIFSHALAKQSGVYDLERDTFSHMAAPENLEPGSYVFRIYADGLNHYVQQGRVVSDSKRICLMECAFSTDGTETPVIPEQEEDTIRDGWLWENDTWYYYEQGVPRTGWYCYHGADYYLQADGSVTTGWTVINGKWRFFSDTGCMRTGWIETDAGQMYLMSNGAPATGTRIMDGKTYRFDENGILQ